MHPTNCQEKLRENREEYIKKITEKLALVLLAQHTFNFFQVALQTSDRIINLVHQMIPGRQQEL